MPGSSYAELQGGHNFCRNLRGKNKKPWCFTDQQVMQLCNVPKCGKWTPGADDCNIGYLLFFYNIGYWLSITVERR